MAEIIPIRDELAQIAAANRIIADQGVAIATAHSVMLKAVKLKMPPALRNQLRSAIRLMEGITS